MIYIIVSNIGLAVMMLVIYFRYSSFRLKNAAEIKNLKATNLKQASEKKLLEEKLMDEIKNAGLKVEKLLKDIDLLRQEKDVELRLRTEAEKQAAVSLQRFEGIEKRMNDWRLIQDAMMDDAKEVMFKIGNDLFRKVNEVQKLEAETNKNLFGRINENIEKSFTKLFGMNFAQKEQKTSEVNKIEPSKINTEGFAKKLITDLITTMKAAGYLANKNYFTPANFDDQKSKLMLCDLAFLKENKLYILDFKACNYFLEYSNSEDKSIAMSLLKQKLDKYITYLSNSKYYEAIAKVMGLSRVNFDGAYIIIAVPSKADLKITKDIRYYEKAHQSSLDIMDFDDINNMVL